LQELTEAQREEYTLPSQLIFFRALTLYILSRLFKGAFPKPIQSAAAFDMTARHLSLFIAGLLPWAFLASLFRSVFAPFL